MKSKIPALMACGCVILMALGVLDLFRLRFEGGDVYAPYSSLRADPLGTMALYEGLEQIPGKIVRRDFFAGNRLPEEKRATYLHLAAQRHDWEWLPADLSKEVARFLLDGGRLVVAFQPETRLERHYWLNDFYRSGTNNDAKADQKADGTNIPPAIVPKKDSEPPVAAKAKRNPVIKLNSREQLGVEFEFEKLVRDEDQYQPTPVTRMADLPLPETLEWHSGMIFTNLDKAWRVIYARGTNPVVIERAIGKGTVVLASDCYFFSNEAMQQHREPRLVAWLVGPAQTVVFDEAHLGTVEQSGIVILIRKYRLHGLAAALLVLAGLFIWKNSQSLVPWRESAAREDYVAGKSAASGLANLLRRHIPEKDILGVCVAEWMKSFTRSRRASAARREKVEAVMAVEAEKPPAERNPVAAYRTICETLKVGGKT